MLCVGGILRLHTFVKIVEWWWKNDEIERKGVDIQLPTL